MLKNAYLGLGSNLGNRIWNIDSAIALLSKNNKILKVSSVYETEPVGYKNQAWFLNCVVKVRTNLSPLKLLSEINKIESHLKRKRKIRFGPRTIDIDVLMYGNDIIALKQLVVPHPRMHERKFVLMPMAELAGAKVHPVFRKSIFSLLKNIKDESVVTKYHKIYSGNTGLRKL